MKEGDMRFENVPVPVDYVQMSGRELASINDYARLLTDRFPAGHVDTRSEPTTKDGRTVHETVAIHDDAVEIVHELIDDNGGVVRSRVIKAQNGALLRKDGEEWTAVLSSANPETYGEFARANRLMMEAGVRLLSF